MTTDSSQLKAWHLLLGFGVVIGLPFLFLLYYFTSDLCGEEEKTIHQTAFPEFQLTHTIKDCGATTDCGNTIWLQERDSIAPSFTKINIGKFTGCESKIELITFDKNSIKFVCTNCSDAVFEQRLPNGIEIIVKEE